MTSKHARQSAFGTRTLISANALVLLSCTAWAGGAAQTGFRLSGASPKSVVGLFNGNTYAYRDPATSTQQSVIFGNPGDVPVAADYDGDGITDLAIYRPDAAQFWWKRSSDGVIGGAAFGNPGDIPIAADFDGDSKTDVAVYRPSEGVFWYRKSSSAAVGAYVLGHAGSTPLAGDLDADGRSDPIVYDSRTRTFQWVASATQQARSRVFASASPAAIPLVGNYLVSNRSTLAVYEPVAGSAKFIYDNGPALGERPFTGPGIPLSVDYDGDGLADFAIAQSGNGNHTVSYLSSANPNSPAATVVLGSTASYDKAVPLGRPYYQPGWTGNLTSSSPFLEQPGTVQTLYRNGVPHTTGNGQLLSSKSDASFLPLCLYHTVQGSWGGVQYQAFQEAQAAGFNCVHSAYNADNVFDWRAPNIYNALANTTLKGIIDIGANYNTGVPLSATQVEEIRAHVRNRKTHPSVLAWKLEDEGSSRDSSAGHPRLTNYQNLLTTLHAEDLQRPFFNLDVAYPSPPVQPSFAVVEATWKAWNVNAPARIVSIDHYPFHFDEVTLGGTELSIGVCDAGVASLPDSVRKAAELNNQARPVWFTLQAFERLQNSAPDGAHYRYKMPSAAQLRLQAFTGLIHGATGLIYFSYDSFASRAGEVVGIAPAPLKRYHTGIDLVDNDQRERSITTWQAAKMLNAELAGLQDALLSKTSSRSYKVFTESPGSIVEAGCTADNWTSPRYSVNPVRTLLKEDRGLFTLFVVNLDKRAVKARFEFPGLAPANLTELQQGGKAIPVAQGNDSFSAQLQAWDARIYQFKSASSN